MSMMIILVIVRAFQLGGEILLAMPAHAVAFSLLHAVPVWLQIAGAILTLLFSAALTCQFRDGKKAGRNRKAAGIPTRRRVQVVVIGPGNDVSVFKNIDAEELELLVRTILRQQALTPKN